MTLTVMPDVSPPEDQLLALRSYRKALAVGDYALAGKSAAIMIRAGTAPPDTAVLEFAVAANAGDRAGEDAAILRFGAGPLSFMLPVLKAWLAVERGEDGMAPLIASRSNPMAARYAAHHRPLLMIAKGRSGDAMVSLAAMLSPEEADSASDDLRIDAAELLAATGSRDQALPLLGGNRSDYALLRKRLGKGAKPGIRFGASRLFLGVAQDIAGQGIFELSIAMARAALLLDPGDDRARLYLAEALSQIGADDIALAELGKVAKDSPYHRGAQSGLIAAYRRAGRTNDAVALGAKLARDRDASAEDARVYGDLLAADGQYAAAATAYAAALKRTGGNGGWKLNYLRGAALDRAGQWDRAQPLLREAVALGPDQAPALAYLGGAQVRRGENLAEAQDFLERAHAINGNDNGITASLGWAYFSRGDVVRALPLLEKAAQRDPGGVMPNENLGDAYWQLGRHYEARYAWNAAAIYADAEAAKRIQNKIALGL